MPSRLTIALANVARLAPLAHGRADRGAYIGPYLRAVRELVRAQHEAGVLVVVS
jgi:hypothetical protein